MSKNMRSCLCFVTVNQLQLFAVNINEYHWLIHQPITIDFQYVHRLLPARLPCYDTNCFTTLAHTGQISWSATVRAQLAAIRLSLGSIHPSAQCIVLLSMIYRLHATHRSKLKRNCNKFSLRPPTYAMMLSFAGRNTADTTLHIYLCLMNFAIQPMNNYLMVYD